MTAFNPWRDMEVLRREIDRLFDGYGGSGGRRPFSRSAFLPGLGARAYPLVNLGQDQDNVYVQALAPGLDPDALQITMQGDQLTISGEKQPVAADVTPDAWHRNERSAGRFTRSLTMPAEIDSENVKADYRNGLLLITRPKAEAAKPKQITVNVS